MVNKTSPLKAEQIILIVILLACWSGIGYGWYKVASKKEKAGKKFGNIMVCCIGTIVAFAITGLFIAENFPSGPDNTSKYPKYVGPGATVTGTNLAQTGPKPVPANVGPKIN